MPLKVKENDFSPAPTSDDGKILIFTIIVVCSYLFFGINAALIVLLFFILLYFASKLRSHVRIGNFHFGTYSLDLHLQNHVIAYSLGCSVLVTTSIYILFGLYQAFYKFNQEFVLAFFYWFGLLAIAFPFFLGLFYPEMYRPPIEQFHYHYLRYVRTTSDEWYLFGVMISIIVTIITIILSDISEIICFIGIIISLNVLWWSFIYDTSFIKTGHKIELFEKIRMPLNKRHKQSDTDIIVYFIIALTVSTGSTICLLLPFIFQLFAVLLLSLLLTHILLKIWSRDEIIHFLHN